MICLFVPDVCVARLGVYSRTERSMIKNSCCLLGARQCPLNAFGFVKFRVKKQTLRLTNGFTVNVSRNEFVIVDRANHESRGTK